MKHLLLLLLLAVPFMARSQSDSLTATAVSQTPKPSPPHQSPFALMLSAGTAGGGLAVGYSIKPQLAARLGLNLFSFGSTILSGKETDDLQISFDYKIKLQSANLLLDYYPFKRTGVRVTGGFFYNLNEITFFGTPAKDLKLNDVVLTVAEVGTLDGRATFSKLAPYIGLGFGNPYTRHRLKFMFDFGFFYQQSPQISFITTGYLTPSQDQAPVIERNLSPLKYYPILSLGLSYKL